MSKLTWNYGVEGAIFAAIFGVVGTFANVFLGGWDLMTKLLLGSMVIDFALGIASVAKNKYQDPTVKGVDSKVMFWGGLNKAIVLLIVGLGVLLDGALAGDAPYIRTAIVWFYFGREALSITENLGKLGVPIPPMLSRVLEQLEEKNATK